eukprot:CAMPEP_0197650914 /NCGR_PEP_ID=MMETSP1338-20131121/31237_1 /TAXON_ID=43686 ORGANISM="Pelagodinium beii, Strain RCC1491" /NCGR_SAMPLE_ID=MMETSP1338 /ASSEMBLY_ACC=CAM_ASM_000754 /LENGTH=274 /DNA_ID=CAMNT_0043225427 /DNA_START=84 /DNA_END=908 /DNA_ORIENTATION=-
MAPKRSAVRVLGLLSAVAAIRLLTSAFVSPPGRGKSSLRGHTVLAADDKETGGGFASFLKVQDEPEDLELSPEEFKVALEQEMLAERKKYYISGKAMIPRNLVVPWKPVDEEEVEKEARKNLKKNGILDPDGEPEAEEEDTDFAVNLVGGDVKISWTGGLPKQKIGYVVERKEKSQDVWAELASYENGQNPQLLCKPYPGFEHVYRDVMVRPSQYSYRVLCKNRDGDVNIVEQKDILISDPEGIDDRKSIWFLAGILVLYAAYCTLMKPQISWD